MPPPRPPTLAHLSPTALEARATRQRNHAKAAQTVADLLDHPSGTLRLAAAQDIQDRLEGRARQSVSVEAASPEQERERSELAALFEHVERVQPERFGDVAAWLRSLSAGEVPAVPAGLVAPTTGPAADLWSRAVAASAVVEALP